MRLLLALIAALLLQSGWERAARLAESQNLAGAEAEYREMLEDEPDDPELHYNLGTVLVLQQRYDEARPHLARAASEGVPPGAASYNLGNVDLEPAFADTTLADREQRLRQAIEAYKGALLADSQDQDAKWNLELARRLLVRDTPPPESGGGGGSGGGDGPPQEGQRQPAPTAGGGAGPQPRMTQTEAENLLRSAQLRELEVQRDRLKKPQPPGPIRP